MSELENTPTPIADALGLREIIRDLIADLADLRAGSITVNDALARAALAKQIWNGVRLYMTTNRAIDPPHHVPEIAARAGKETT